MTHFDNLKPMLDAFEKWANKEGLHEGVRDVALHAWKGAVGAMVGITLAYPDTSPARDGRTTEEINDNLIKQPVEIKSYPVKRDAYSMPDDRPIFGESSPHDIGEHLDSVIRDGREVDEEMVGWFKSLVDNKEKGLNNLRAYSSDVVAKTRAQKEFDYYQRILRLITLPTAFMGTAAPAATGAEDTTKAHDSVVSVPAAAGADKAAQDVIAERRRQIESEGWTPEHDDKHLPGELALAGACYAAWDFPGIGDDFQKSAWPWSKEWWKPKVRRKNLVKAGALILAEIERLDRKSPPAKGE